MHPLQLADKRPPMINSFISTDVFEMDGRAVSLIILLLCSLINAGDVIRRKRIVGGISAAKPPVDDPVVFVNKNDRDARIVGTRDPNKGFYVFRGIRFGQPPTGRARFQVKRRSINIEVRVINILYIL